MFVLCFWFQEKPKENIESVIVNRLTEAIKNGIQVLDTKFETIEVSASDSDDDEDNSPHRWVFIKPSTGSDVTRPFVPLLGRAAHSHEKVFKFRA